MSDNTVTLFDKYFRHALLLTEHSDPTIVNQANKMVEIAEKRSGGSELAELPPLEEGSSDDELAIQSVNYIQLKLIQCLDDEYPGS